MTGAAVPVDHDGLSIGHRRHDGDVVRGEVGEVLLGRRPGRRSADDITLFKSLGVAAEDLMLANLLCERASS